MLIAADVENDCQQIFYNAKAYYKGKPTQLIASTDGRVVKASD